MFSLTGDGNKVLSASAFSSRSLSWCLAYAFTRERGRTNRTGKLHFLFLF